MEKIFAEKRNVVGRKTRGIKNKGLIPAVLYGKTTKAISLETKEKDFLESYKKVGSSSVAELNVGKNKHMVLVYDVQRDGINNKIIHIDFYKPESKEKITTSIPLIFVGVAPAVKEFNGTFISNMKEIKIKAFLLDLPKDITIDISSLRTLEDSITINDLVFSDKLEVVQDKNSLVASISSGIDVDAELEKEIGDVEDVKIEETGKKDKEDEEEK